MKLLVDMNLSPRWCGFLTNAGIESTHWSTVGAPAARDAEIMAYAAANGLVVLTNDLDFSAILAITQGNKPSVVQIRGNDVSVDAIGTQVLHALRQVECEIEEGALLTIDSRRARVRLLPLSQI